MILETNFDNKDKKKICYGQSTSIFIILNSDLLYWFKVRKQESGIPIRSTVMHPAIKEQVISSIYVGALPAALLHGVTQND